jgi:2'-5' RNA ligase
MRGAGDLAALQRMVVDRLSRLSLTLEERAYHPHLTIARWRSAARADGQRALQQATPGLLIEVDVSAVTLFESRLSSAGSTYIALCHSPLRESAVPPLQSTS